jgi:hypothetical protein
MFGFFGISCTFCGIERDLRAVSLVLEFIRGIWLCSCPEPIPGGLDFQRRRDGLSKYGAVYGSTDNSPHEGRDPEKP